MENNIYLYLHYINKKNTKTMSTMSNSWDINKKGVNHYGTSVMVVA